MQLWWSELGLWAGLRTGWVETVCGWKRESQVYRDPLNPCGPVNEMEHREVGMKGQRYNFPLDFTFSTDAAPKICTTEEWAGTSLNWRISMSFHTHMSKKLSGVLKIKVIRVGVDQHSGGLDFGSVGYLLEKEEEKKRSAHKKRQGRKLQSARFQTKAQTFSAKLILPALTSMTLPFMLICAFCSSAKSRSSP